MFPLSPNFDSKLLTDFCPCNVHIVMKRNFIFYSSNLLDVSLAQPIENVKSHQFQRAFRPWRYKISKEMNISISFNGFIERFSKRKCVNTISKTLRMQESGGYFVRRFSLIRPLPSNACLSVETYQFHL